MFRIGFCDDNPGYIDLFGSIVADELTKIVLPKHDFEFVSFNSAEKVLTYVMTNRIDVLFLDIDMPKMSGFELAKALDAMHRELLIVFISAYDNFVYESFDYSPFSYLRKSNVPRELPKLLNRINEKLFIPTKYITLTVANDNVNVDIKNILYFESQKNYYAVHLTDGNIYQCRGTMTSLEEKVKLYDFFRTHSAFLVNLQHVCRIDEGLAYIGSKKVPVSQKRMKEFKKVFSEYIRRKAGV